MPCNICLKIAFLILPFCVNFFSLSPPTFRLFKNFPSVCLPFLSLTLSLFHYIYISLYISLPPLSITLTLFHIHTISFSLSLTILSYLYLQLNKFILYLLFCSLPFDLLENRLEYCCAMAKSDISFII